MPLALSSRERSCKNRLLQCTGRRKSYAMLRTGSGKVLYGGIRARIRLEQNVGDFRSTLYVYTTTHYFSLRDTFAGCFAVDPFRSFPFFFFFFFFFFSQDKFQGPPPPICSVVRHAYAELSFSLRRQNPEVFEDVFYSLFLVYILCPSFPRSLSSPLQTLADILHLCAELEKGGK